MDRLTPLQIKNISKVIALPYEQKEDPNYLSAQQLVDYFNAFGFGDDYRYPSVGIVTADIGENLSRQKYALERFNQLTQMGRFPEAIELFLHSVKEPLLAQQKIHDILQQSVPNVDLSAFKNNNPAVAIPPTKAPVKTEYSQFADIKEDSIVVFISYAWDDTEHKQWVRKLSDDLRANGVYTLLDDYNPGGANLLDFMRRGIKMARRVLVIGSPRYKQKLEDCNPSGVAFEDQIMTIEMFNGVQEKFIPILHKGSFNSSFSELMSIQTGFDFSDGTQYEAQLMKLVADLKGNPLNAAPKVQFAPIEVKTANVTENREWETIFSYSTLLPEEIERAYDSALDVLANPDSLRIFELAKLIFVLCKLDQDGVTLSKGHFEIIERALAKKFNKAPSFDDLHELKIEFYQTMDLCGYRNVDFPSLDRILSYLRELLDRLESEKRWLLVIYLEQLTEENSKLLIGLHETAPDNGTPYSSMPLFDKVDAERMFESIISTTPNAVLELRKFLVERYKLVYPLTSDNSSFEFREDIENLALLHSRLKEYITTLKPIARLNYIDLLDRIEKSIMRCEGDRRALVH